MMVQQNHFKSLQGYFACHIYIYIYIHIHIHALVYTRSRRLSVNKCYIFQYYIYLLLLWIIFICITRDLEQCCPTPQASQGRVEQAPQLTTHPSLQPYIFLPTSWIIYRLSAQPVKLKALNNICSVLSILQLPVSFMLFSPQQQQGCNTMHDKGDKGLICSFSRSERSGQELLAILFFFFRLFPFYFISYFFLVVSSILYFLTCWVLSVWSQ